MLSKFQFLSFVTTSVLSHSEFCHNLSFVLSHIWTLHKFWVYEYYHTLSLWVVSKYSFYVLSNFIFLNFPTIWFFSFGRNWAFDFTSQFVIWMMSIFFLFHFLKIFYLIFSKFEVCFSSQFVFRTNSSMHTKKYRKRGGCLVSCIMCHVSCARSKIALGGQNPSANLLKHWRYFRQYEEM